MTSDLLQNNRAPPLNTGHLRTVREPWEFPFLRCVNEQSVKNTHIRNTKNNTVPSLNMTHPHDKHVSFSSCDIILTMFQVVYFCDSDNLSPFKGKL